MTPNLHLWLIPLLPLIGSAINGLFGRRFPRRTVAAVALAFGVALTYVAYSWWGSGHVPEVVRWSLQWRNNLPPDGLSFGLALAPQLVLAALGVPGALRRRSRGVAQFSQHMQGRAMDFYIPGVPLEKLREAG